MTNKKDPDITENPDSDTQNGNVYQDVPNKKDPTWGLGRAVNNSITSDNENSHPEVAINDCVKQTCANNSIPNQKQPHKETQTLMNLNNHLPRHKIIRYTGPLNKTKDPYICICNLNPKHKTIIRNEKRTCICVN